MRALCAEWIVLFAARGVRARVRCTVQCLGGIRCCKGNMLSLGGQYTLCHKGDVAFAVNEWPLFYKGECVVVCCKGGAM